MKKKGTDFLNQLIQFQQEIIKNKPTIYEMMTEVRMMKFRIRPLDGDVTKINFNNDQLIETLWNLGKIDDFFQKEYHNLENDQRQIFYHFIDRLYQKFQDQLNKIRLKGDAKLQEPSNLVEMEIFKDKPQVH